MKRAREVFTQRDFLVSLGFVLTNVAAHLVWNPLTVHWHHVAIALILTAALVAWLVKEWPRLRFTMTKCYCIAAAFDLLAEGILQNVHKCTTANILCAGRMWAVLLAGWFVTVAWSWYRVSEHPVETGVSNAENS